MIDNDDFSVLDLDDYKKEEKKESETDFNQILKDKNISNEDMAKMFSAFIENLNKEESKNKEDDLSYEFLKTVKKENKKDDFDFSNDELDDFDYKDENVVEVEVKEDEFTIPEKKAKIPRPKLDVIDLDEKEEEINKEQKKEKKEKVKKKDNKKIYWIIIAVALLFLAYVFKDDISGFINVRDKVSETTDPGEDIKTVTIEEDTEEITGMLFDESQEETPMFTATGYYDISIYEGENIYLINDAENRTEDYDIFLQYELYEVVDGEDIPVLSTGLIEPAKQVAWNASEYLSKGNHKIHMIEQPYTIDANGDYVPRFSCDQYIEVTIN